MINNADDLINLLESNDEFRNAVRRWVLTEELLALPAVVRDLQGRMSNVERQMVTMQEQIAELQRQVAELQAQMLEMQRQMSEMNARLIRVEEDVAVLKDDVAVLKDDVAVLKSDVKTIKDDIGALKGWQLQERLHRNGAQQIGDRFDIPNPKVIRAAGTGVSLPDFNGDARRAKKEGVLSDREYDRLMNTDMIMSGRDSDGADIYVVAEASFALTSADIDKVLYSADLFRRIYPERDVRTALWYVNVDYVRRNAAESAGIELVRTQIKHG